MKVKVRNTGNIIETNQIVIDIDGKKFRITEYNRGVLIEKLDTLSDMIIVPISKNIVVK